MTIDSRTLPARSHRTVLTRRRVAWSTLAAMALVEATAACTSTGGGSGAYQAPTATWSGVADHVPFESGQDFHLVGGTSTDWYAIGRLRFDAALPIAEGNPVAETTLYPRTGANGNELGTPQVLSPTLFGVIDGMLPSGLVPRPFLGNKLLLTGATVAGAPNQIFLDIDGTWALAGTFTLPAGEKVVDFDDGHLVTTKSSYRTSYTDRAVLRSGETVTIGAGVDFDVPASWPSDVAVLGSFDGDLDGDVFAATFSTTPGAGTIYHHRTMVAHLGGPSPVVDAVSGDRFGYNGSVAVDDLGAGKARIALGVDASSVEASHAELWLSSVPGTWAQEADLTSPPWLPLADAGTYFGNRVGLDGDLLVVSSRLVSTPTTLNSTGVLRVGQLVGYERGTGGWLATDALDTTAEPFEPGASLRLATGHISVAGGHVAVLVGSDRIAPSTPYFETWRFDRPA